MIDIIINEKPVSVSIRYNGYYKVVLLLSIINYCASGKKASLELIHVVFWSLRSKDNFKVLYDVSKGARTNLISWTFEHGIESVLALGYINGYIERELITGSLNIKITAKGMEVVNEVNRFQLFQDEINSLKELGFITKTKLAAANKHWDLI